MVGLVGTRSTLLGSIVLKEPDYTYSREVVSVVVPDGGLVLGAVLAQSDSDGSYSIVTDSTFADASAILVDEHVTWDEYQEAGTYDMTAIVRGWNGVVVATDNLDTGDVTDASDLATNLMTNSGIRADIELV